MASNWLNFPLPEDLTIDILLRLPFESLIQCKRVSKQWKNLINGPKFHCLYRNKSFAVLLGPHAIRTILCITTTRQQRFHLLSGWSNGMVCVKKEAGPFHVYNLFTGASHQVEAPLQEHTNRAWICCGFGYDRYEDDYKILVVCDYRCKNYMEFEMDMDFEMDTFQNEENSLFWVYSFRSGSWESFHGFPRSGVPRNGHLGCTMRPEARSFNGVLHWARRRGQGKCYVIITYDLHTRRFGEISFPSIACSGNEQSASELDGSLCFVNETDLCNGCRMEVYGIGDGESWTKLFNFHLSRGEELPLRWLAYTMLYECGDGRRMVLFVCNYRSKLFRYDIDNKEVQIIKYHACDNWDCDN